MVRHCVLPLAQDMRVSVKPLVLAALISLRENSLFVYFQKCHQYWCPVVAPTFYKKCLIVFIGWPMCFLLSCTAIFVVCVLPVSA